MELSLPHLEQFIVEAKRHTYVGNGKRLLPYRLGTKDLQYSAQDWTYHDSYAGESNFIGQELVYLGQQPVWGMNYFGVILRPELLTSAQAGQMIKKSLSKLYEEGRFLGGFTFQDGSLTYIDTNEGDVSYFRGLEYINVNEVRAYELHYHGGLLL